MAIGPKPEKATGGWRVLHNEKIHDLDFYSWKNVSRLINHGK
jgi:hypothetical protein